MGRVLDWLQEKLPDSRPMCLAYLAFAGLCVWEGIETIASQKLMVGRRGGKFALLEGPAAVASGVLLFVVALALVLLCLRYVREMRNQYRGYS